MWICLHAGHIQLAAHLCYTMRISDGTAAFRLGQCVGGLQFVKRPDLQKKVRVNKTGQAGFAYASDKRMEAEAAQQRQLEQQQKSHDKFSSLCCLTSAADVDMLAAGPSEFSWETAPGGRFKQAFDTMKWHHDQLALNNPEAAVFTAAHSKQFNSTRATMDSQLCRLPADGLSDADRSKLQAKLLTKSTPSCAYCANVGPCCKKALLKLMVTQSDLPPCINGVPPTAPRPTVVQSAGANAAAPMPPVPRSRATQRMQPALSQQLAVSDDSSNFTGKAQHRSSAQSIGSVPARPAAGTARGQRQPVLPRARSTRRAGRQALDYARMAAGSPVESEDNPAGDSVMHPAPALEAAAQRLSAAKSQPSSCSQPLSQLSQE